jgi:hypothetical protein
MERAKGGMERANEGHAMRRAGVTHTAGVGRVPCVSGMERANEGHAMRFVLVKPRLVSAHDSHFAGGKHAFLSMGGALAAAGHDVHVVRVVPVPAGTCGMMPGWRGMRRAGWRDMGHDARVVAGHAACRVAGHGACRVAGRAAG